MIEVSRRGLLGMLLATTAMPKLCESERMRPTFSSLGLPQPGDTWSVKSSTYRCVARTKYSSSWERIA